MGQFLNSFGWVVPVGIVVVILIVLLASGYVKAPPDQAYIISGLKKEGKILIGRAGIRIPFFERLDKLYLGQMTVDIKTGQSVPTNDFINVNVDAVAKVRISTDSAMLVLAAKNFLNKKPDEITRDLQDSLQGNMREIIGTLSLRDINTDRDSFSDQVMLKASRHMQKLGIEILSCNIQNVTDETGLIQDLGADNTARIKKDASIARAQSERDVAIAQADAEREAGEARVKSETILAQKTNELNLLKHDLQKKEAVKKAEADAAGQIETQVQQKTIEQATVDAQIAKAQREAELREQQVKVREQELAATIRAQADAERYKAQQVADAELYKRQRDAEAKLYELQQDAEAEKAMAEAGKFAKEQEAAGIRAVGEAEAKAIEAKGLAEAAAIDKKADAMQKYGEAAIVEMVTKVLPEVAANVASPLSKVDKITMYGEGNAAKLVGDIVNGTTQASEGVLEGLGIDLKSVLSGLLGGYVGRAGVTSADNVPEEAPADESGTAATSEGKIPSAAGESM